MNKVANSLQMAGLRSGDVAIVHSNIKLAQKWANGDTPWEGCRYLLEGFEEMGCTAIAPTFNYDFCIGTPYNHHTSPSQVGIFGQYLMAVGTRSFHPIFSFASKSADLMQDVSKSAFGTDSVFDRVYRANGWVVFFNVPFSFCTFVHYVEQKLGVPYRYHKNFSGEVTRDGKTWTDTFDFFVRNLDINTKVDLNNLYEDLCWFDRVGTTVSDGGYVLAARCWDIENMIRERIPDNPQYLSTYDIKELT